MPATWSPRALSVAAFDRLMRPLAPSARLGIAVSGGADSVALMLLLSKWCDRLAEKGGPVPAVTVLTVDHGLRPEAAEEVRQVRRWARALSLPCKVLRWDGDKPAGNIQAEARAARYRLLTDWCRAGRVKADLITAHHLDDQAETFLMRLQRGSGVDGLAAMAPVSERAGVRLLRPLLDVPRAQLLATLTQADHPWIEDPSNEDTRFLRVQVRNALPLLEELGIDRARLVSTARSMARARGALERATDELESVAVVWHPCGFAAADPAAFAQAPDEIALRLLARLLRKAGGLEHAPRLAALEAALGAIRGGGLGRGRTLGGVKLSGRAGSFLAVREAAAVDPAPVDLKAGRPVLWDGRFEVRLRGRGASGTVRALGSDGLRQVKADGVMFPAGVPKLALQTLPALWAGKKVLAQPLLEFAAPGAPVFETKFPVAD